MKIRIGMRLPTDNKPYWTRQLELFAARMNQAEVLEVQYGKQDIRGTESITLVDHRHCVPKQVHFENKWALLGYVQGYNSAHADYHDDFGQFKATPEKAA